MVDFMAPHTARAGWHFLLVALLLLMAPFHLAAEVVDKVVAVVNDDIITFSELEAEAAPAYQAIARQNEGASMFAALEEAREATLNSMIDQLLVEQKAKQFNVTVSDEEVNQAFERVRQQSSLSASQFQQKLAESGMTEANYKNKMKVSILQNKLLSIDVRSKIAISDEMVREYYEENYTSKVTGGSFYLLQIGFSWEDSAASGEGSEKALEMAERIRKLAVSGQDFQELAKKFSDLPSASDGGDIGTFTLDEMAPAMRSAVANLTPGEISEIIETPAGYQFLNCFPAIKTR